MKKIFFLFSILFLSEITFSQINLEVTKNNPDPDFIEFHIPFLSLDFSPSNSTFFGDFGMRLKKQKFYTDIEYRIDYLNGLEEYYYSRETPEATSVYYTKSPKSLFINIGYTIKQDEEETEAHFHLKSSGNVTYYTTAPVTQSDIMMVNLGFRKGFTWVNCTKKELIFENNGSSSSFTPPLPEQVSTMMDYTYLQVGVSNIKLGYWEANIEGYGKRKSSRFIMYYTNLLLLINSKIDPIYYGQPIDQSGNNLLYTKYDLNKSKRSVLGLNIGASMNNISRFGLIMGAEVGYIPGIKGSILSNLSFTINSKIYFGKLLN